MTGNSFDKRNFLFFLNKIYPPKFEDSLIGAFLRPSTWNAVARMVSTARRKNVFVQSVNKALLYVHVPFCGRLCTFCHCEKILLRRHSDIDVYIKALTRQMMVLAPIYKGMNTSLICFGGGTPSILNERHLTAILDGGDKAFPARDRKILFEANPSSWTASKLALLSSRGLYRLSIGVESLEEKVLKLVSRSQTKKKVLWCLHSARKAKVPHVNVDLIAGLPGQTIKGFINDLEFVINEGANIVHVYPYCKSSMKGLCGPGESFPMFFKRRDCMMKAAALILQGAGFRRKGLEAYTRNGEGDEDQEEVYLRLGAAVAAIGPSVLGQIPGAAFYRMGQVGSTADFTGVDACVQDVDYVMSHYAIFALMSELDEKLFFQRFGVTLDQHCGEGLRYLQQSGLVVFSRGIWKYFGEWEIRRIHEFVALSRVLFGEKILFRLRSRYIKEYDPRQDYSEGNALFMAYGNTWVMNLYYQMGH